MHRRRAAFLACIGLLMLVAQPCARAASTEEGRRTTTLTQSWRFRFGDVADDASSPNFDDGAWQAISIPHTWNRLGEYSLERSDVTNNDRGIGWYRLRFKAPAGARDERHYLQFDAVGTLADVWLNGVKVGSHAGAFSRFRFDVTSTLRPGQDNVLVVKVDNTKPAPGATTQDVIPLGGDFFVHGGLYRAVSLITTHSMHVDMLDYAGPGVYASTPRISSERADVTVLVRLRNDGGKARKTTVVTRVVDTDGREVAQDKQSVRLAASSNAELRANLVVRNTRLWNGRADPYLYELRVELREGAKPLDVVAQPLGIRSIRVDPNEGLFLNGKHVPLYGVSRHQDRAGKGWALSTADHEEDMALIAEVGANAVRFAHYQHAPEWFELAGRYGMLVWSEVPFVNETNFTADEPTLALVANARQQLIEGM